VEIERGQRPSKISDTVTVSLPEGMERRFL
jgi:hypothetical protein